MQGIKNLIAYCLVVGAILAMAKTSSASPALGDPPDPLRPWGEFAFNGLGDTSVCTACTASSGNNSFFLGASPWTFSGSGFLIVQDAFFRGDQFEVFDGLDSMGLTSSPGLIDDPIDGPGCGSNPVTCFTDPGSSHGIFALGAGDHSFTITVIAAPFGPGAGYLCIDSGQGECGVGPIDGSHEVPEPMSMLLLGLGLVAGSFWTRRQQINLKCGLQRALAWRSSRQRKKLI
jgi:PEP-CTERM motif-containing protein